MKIHTRDNFISVNVNEFSDFEQMDSYPHMLPPTFVTDKASWKAWLSLQSTQRHIYSYVGGLQPKQIVSVNNPIATLNGFIVDVDEELTETDLLDAIAQNCPAEYRPTYIMESFSGRWHLLYPFDGTVSIQDAVEYEAIVKVFFALSRLGKVSAKIDQKAMCNPGQYYTFGKRWFKPFPNDNTEIKRKVINLIRYQVGGQGVYDSIGVVVPFDRVKEEMDKRFPNHGYAQVSDGARGKRFWDPASTDATAAVIRSTGVQFFSDMGGFMSWASIFGDGFVREYQEDSVGAAISNVFFDGNRYYHQIRGKWASDSSETIRNILKVNYGVSDKKVKGRSQMEEVLGYIQTDGRIAGALPFLFNDQMIVTYEGEKWVNTSTIRPLRPSDHHPADWGDLFPNLAKWLDHFYGDVHQRDVFLAWLKVYYESALRGVPSKGQALINVGGVHIGKTLLVTQVVSRMFGSSNDIAPFICGEEVFNKAMFNAGINYIDDQVGFSNFKVRERFSSMLKKLVANTEVAYMAKFKDTVKMPFYSRIMVAMNDDPQSLELLPMLTDSVKDKIILLKCNNIPYPFPSGYQMQDLIVPELPFFCRWLLDWTPPGDVAAINRYGVSSYLNPDLEEEARSDDEEEIIKNLLISWRKSFFRSIDAKGLGSIWKSTAQLFGDLKSFDSNLEPELRNRWTTVRFGRILTRIVNRKQISWLEAHRKTGARGFVITRPTDDEDREDN